MMAPLCTMAPVSHTNIFQATIAFHFSGTSPRTSIYSCFHADIVTPLENRWRRPYVLLPTLRDQLLDYCFQTSFNSKHEDLPSFTWKMNATLKMQFGGLIGENLEGMAIGFVLNGQSKNVAVESLLVIEDHQLTQRL